MKRAVRVLMPAPVLEQLRAIADERGSTVSGIVREAIGRTLRDHMADSVGIREQ